MKNKLSLSLLLLVFIFTSNAQININEELMARFDEGNAIIEVKKIND